FNQPARRLGDNSPLISRARNLIHMLALFESWQNWQGLALAGALCLAIFLGILALRLRFRTRQFTTAVDHMTQGLCMYDDQERLTLCNKRYIEMYDFPPDVIGPGCTLLEVLEYRVAQGSLTASAAEYRANLVTEMRQGKTVHNLLTSKDGRTIAVINQPMASGGWVGTHYDITDQRRLEKERDEMASRESRRAVIEAAIAVFRERIDKLLKTVGGSADAMKATASTLS